MLFSLIKLLRLPLLFLFHLCLIYILANLLYVMTKYLKTHLRTNLSFMGFSHPNWGYGVMRIGHPWHSSHKLGPEGAGCPETCCFPLSSEQ